MKILGIDLGTTSSKTAASVLDRDSGEIQRMTVPTSTAALSDLIARCRADLVAVEATANVGFVVDLCRALRVQVVVAKTTDEAWRNRASKTDRRDADLLCRLAACGQLTAVHIPERDVRELRSLVRFRQKLVQHRTRVQNHLKAILRQRDIATTRLWTQAGMAALRLLAKPLMLCDLDEAWRGQVWLELQRLQEAERHLADLERLLNARQGGDARIQALTAIPGVGPRLAEAAVAFLDRPTRFANRRQVGAYVGLVPTIRQSCATTRVGRISRAGATELRTLLVQVAWLGIRRDGWMRATFERLCRGDPQRRNRAVVAVARRLLIRCWAILRDLERGITPPAVAA